jgi:hypothetical protein
MEKSYGKDQELSTAAIAENAVEGAVEKTGALRGRRCPRLYWRSDRRPQIECPARLSRCGD